MITVKRKLKLSREAQGRRKISIADSLAITPDVEAGRIPRVSRLMALAIRLERMLITGEIAGISDLAQLGHVSQPRMSQILNLTLLAPDIQEELLFLPRNTAGKAAIHEKLLRPIVVMCDWDRQRQMWQELKQSVVTSGGSQP